MIQPPVALAHPFAIDSAGRVATTTDRSRQIADRILALLSTTPGERVMRPFLGSPVGSALFSSTASVVGLQEQIRREIKKYESDVDVSGVSVNGRSDESTVWLDVTYSINELSHRLTYIATIRVGGAVEEVVSG